MAKGDKKKVQNQVDTTKNTGNDQVNNLMQDTIIPTTQQSQNNMTNANSQAFSDYGNIMGKYESMPNITAPSPYIPISQNSISNQNVNYQKTPEFSEGLGNYRNFAQTGGLSGQDQNSLRERGISPIRSVYENMGQQMSRKNALQGGYSPNFNAASTKMAREGSQLIADRTQNVNADIAQMVQQGKMFGAQGFGNMSQRDLELSTQAAMQNAQSGNQTNQFNEGNRINIEGANRQGLVTNQNQNIDANNANLNKLNSMQNMYSATPGLANSFANQFQNNTGNWLNAQGMNNQVNQNAVGNQFNAAQVPSNFDTGLGRVGQIAQIGGSLAAPFMDKVIPKVAPGGPTGGFNYNFGRPRIDMNAPNILNQGISRGY